MTGPIEERPRPARRVVRRGAAPSAESALPFAQAEVAALAAELGESPALAERRLAAWRTYQDLPLPSLADEPWRRTDLRGLPLGRLGLRPADDLPAPAALLQPLAGDRHGALIVARPGHPAAHSGGEELADRGVIFSDWATAARDHAAALEAAVGQVVRDDEGKFAALAAATARSGVVLIVPPGVELETPLHSVLWAPGADALFSSRVLVVLGEGAGATFVHESASPDVADGAAAHAGIVELSVGAGARLTFVELQSWGRHMWNLTHERARVAGDGALDWIFGAVGSRLTKNFTELELAGRGASGRMSGFYFADGTQHLDHDTQQNHLAEHTTSDLLFKGALRGRSRSVWQGMIYVAPGAQKTDGYQANRNLVLSRQARADSIPGLEILADDVRCTHGATVGQLDPEAVFYLRARGLPRPEAERLLVDGFFDPILQRIPFEGVRERFREMIDAKMRD